MRYDVVVLGGGIVGTSIAVHLQERGRAVALIDRRGPGEETSYGNAGIVEISSLLPAAFPREFAAFAAIVLKRFPGANYHWSALPGLVPWLIAYWRNSAPERLLATARVMQPLLGSALVEHQRLMHEAGAQSLFRDTGWLKIFRNEASFTAERKKAALAAQYGFSARELTREEAQALEPDLKPTFQTGMLWGDLHSVSSPGGVTQAYATYFQKLGGTLLNGDAGTLRQSNGIWTVDTAQGTAEAPEAVIALGPWSMEALTPLGYRYPMAVKRGYHMHYHTIDGARLSRPVLDDDSGYVITPMVGGIRLTTGAEFARRDAPKTPVQLERTEKIARTLFPIAGRAEAEPWMGARPIFPDSRPIIGPAPGHKGLWLAFGHQHLGFTLGPATGRLLAELMTGQKPFVDAAPFGAERFGR